MSLPALELRILSGCHAGARASVAGGECLGAQRQCDFIVTDLGLDVPLWLHLAPGQWGVSSTPAPGQWVLAPLAWGCTASLGAQSLTVCVPDAPWQMPAQAPPALPLAPEPATAASATAAAPVAVRGAAPVAVPVAAPASPPPSRHRTLRVPRPSGRWLVAGALALLALGLTGLWMQALVPPAPLPLPTARALPGAGTAQTAAGALQAVQQALARLQEAAHLRTQLQPNGVVQVSGWVQDVHELDRVAQALGLLPQPPMLEVRTAAQVLDDLGTAVGADLPALRLAVLEAGRISVQGQVLLSVQRDAVLRQLRARLPQGMELLDQLRVAQEQGAPVRQWLRQAGFADAQAQWQGEHLQLALSVPAAQRLRLEALLAGAVSPLQGVPFVLQVREAPAPPRPAAAVHASRAPLPFKISSVVGGETPFLVLDDGTKLLPGADHKGWRLLEIQPQQLVFDGPRRLWVQR